MFREASNSAFTNLDEHQWGLIEVLVSNFESTGGAEFDFFRSTTGSGLSYEGPTSVPGVYDDTDLRQLESERLITIIPNPPGRLRAKLTQRGITMVHRRLTQQFFRHLTATPVRESLKPGGVRFVHFCDASAASKEAESTEGFENGAIGPLMKQTISIPNISGSDYPLDFDDSERDKIKAAEIRAARVVALKKSSVRSTAERETLLLRDWVLPIFAAFSNLACNRAKAAAWPIHKTDQESREFLKVLAASAGMNSPDAWMGGGGRIIRAEIQHEIEDSSEWRRHTEALLELLDAPDDGQPALSQPASLANVANGGGASWQAIEISFLSDERVQIRNGSNTETYNYGELGFADRRAKQEPKPNQAWVTLRTMAEQNGIIRDGAKAGATWAKVEKRIQEIRKVLRKHFRITADPIPFVEGTGYQTCFKIGCSPSFHT
jgi:hypothetical protein